MNRTKLKEMQRNKILGWVIVSSVGYTATSVLLLHFLQPDKNAAVNAISEFVDGQGGFLMSINFFVQSMGSMALAILALGLKPRIRKLVLVGILFMLAALGDVLAGLFQADPITTEQMTEAGMIHTAGGMIRFLSMAIALPLFTSTLKEQQLWQQQGRLLKSLSIAFITLFLVSIFFLAPLGYFGIGQRAFIATALLWMWVVGRPLTRIQRVHELT